MKKEGSRRERGSKGAVLLKLAGIGGIAVPVFMGLLVLCIALLGKNSTIPSIILLVLLLGSIVLFNLGFLAIGRRYGSRSLKFATIAFLVWLVLLVILSAVITPKVAELAQIYEIKAASMGITLSTLDQANAQALMGALQEDAAFSSLASYVSIFLIAILLVFPLLLVVIGVFYAIGIMKSGNPSSYPNLNMERFTGILLLAGIACSLVSFLLPIILSFIKGNGMVIVVGIASFLNFIGFAALLIAYVLQIIILFKESGK